MSLTAPTQTACEACGAPLGEDQRYCLACGTATAAAHRPPPRSAAAPPPLAPVPAAPAGRDWTPVWALGGLLALAVVLIAGVLIGRSGTRTPAAATPIVKVTPGGTAAAGTGAGATGDSASAAGSIATDWPGGASGWTVEIGSLAKSGASASAVDAAKSSAGRKGAPKVGVLDSDQYGSLPGGQYVVYSGRYAGRAEAAAALKKLTKAFPKAKVVHVTTGGGGGGGGAGGGSPGGTPAATGAQAQQTIKNLNQSGSAYENQLKKKPKTIVTPGAAPKKDNKAPGAGGAAQTIG